MDFNNNNLPHFSMIPAFDHHQHLLLPYSNAACPEMNPPLIYSSEAFPQIPVRHTGSEFGMRQERSGFTDPQKMARINRKKAMMRSRNNPCPNSSSNELVVSRRHVMLNLKTNVQIAPEEDLYLYSTFDNKKLKILLVKDLKNSDVGSLGRIVLPKREAEVNLPELSGKEGMMLKIRDANSMQFWSFKYKFWSNNKSRMYVLENTGEFVRKNRVEMGDSLTIYEDQSKNLYYSIRKPGNQNVIRQQDESMEMNNYDEEEASIAMLIGNLNDHYPIPIDFQHHQATSSLPPVDHVTISQHVGSSNDHVSLNDFVW